MPDEASPSPQSWTSQQRTALVLSVLKGEVSIEDAACTHGLAVSEIEAWREEFLAMAERAVRSGNTEEAVADGTPGNELGVWVCAGRRDSLAPCLLMQAACPDRFPLAATARWAGTGRPPKPFERSGELSLLHGVCSPDSRESTTLLLFGAKISAATPFERRSTLSNWRFPVEVAGILVLLEARGEGELLGRRPFILGTSAGQTLVWVRSQELPLVVAVMGSEPGDFPEERFRRSNDLESDIPIVAGPSLVRSRLPKRDHAGMLDRLSIASLLGTGDLAFDADYASRLVARLKQEIEREKP